jgi:hypothetical protein
VCRNLGSQLPVELGDFATCPGTSGSKASGSAHGANAPVERRQFRLLGGEDTLREFESSPGKLRVFCSRCGSPIYAYLTASPDVLRIRLGSLDTPFSKSPRAHTWVSDKAPWEPIADDLPQFPQWASRSVLQQKGSRQP